ncbi:helix-turn-helix transcriptional regulator [Rhizobium sp. BG4]|uniref:helix-turn-helix domain-containing protein n=1 Tax=Rhizobium sp. BG4 TaxID=2613770 RepID=UPI00193D23B5|nr:helix-turn-helix transcriptional regulator [Rhizobium sp. BG4]
MEFRVRAVVEDAKATFRDRLGELCTRSGFTHFLVCQYPNCGTAPLVENIVATNWPAAFLRGYADVDIRSERSFLGHFRSSIALIREVDIKTPPDVTRSLSGFFPCSIAYTLFTSARQQYVFVMSSPSPEIDDAAIGQAIFETMEYLARLTERRPLRPDISQRETECLFWAAAGKSSEDIGAILCLSSHTVNDYLKSAMKKLESINRTQAVAKATRLGVI